MSVHCRWVIVAAGGLMGCVAIGSMFSLPVFLSPIAQATGWSRTGLSTAMTINFLALAVTGFGWGILVDRFGPRLVVLSGGVLLGLGIALAGRSQSLLLSAKSAGRCRNVVQRKAAPDAIEHRVSSTGLATHA